QPAKCGASTFQSLRYSYDVRTNAPYRVPNNNRVPLIVYTSNRGLRRSTRIFYFQCWTLNVNHSKADRVRGWTLGKSFLPNLRIKGTVVRIVVDDGQREKNG